MSEKDVIEEEGNPRKGEDNYQILLSNMKVQLDNLIAATQLQVNNGAAQGQVNNTTAALSLQQAVAFQEKANDMYLANQDAREKQVQMQTTSEHNQRLEHENEIETTRQENMRYTLNYLLGVEGPEAAGLAALAKSVSEILDKKK